MPFMRGAAIRKVGFVLRGKREKNSTLWQGWRMNWPVYRTVLLAIPLLSSCVTAKSAQQQPGQEHTVVARLEGSTDAAGSAEVMVRSGHQSAAATLGNPLEIQKQIAILVDAGPSQVSVLSREKDLAESSVKALSAPGTSFVIGKIGLSGRLGERAVDEDVAINSIHEIAGETGKRTDVPIYDLVVSAIQKLSEAPGIRVVIFIGGGKDSGSRSNYENVRNLAQGRHVTVLTLLLADRSHRGPKSMLSHGWLMRELADETAGIFLENPKSPKALRRVTESVPALRLVSFRMDFKEGGRHKIRVRSKGDLHLRVQKALFLEKQN